MCFREQNTHWTRQVIRKWAINCPKLWLIKLSENTVTIFVKKMLRTCFWCTYSKINWTTGGLLGLLNGSLTNHENGNWLLNSQYNSFQFWYDECLRHSKWLVLRPLTKTHNYMRLVSQVSFHVLYIIQQARIFRRNSKGFFCTGRKLNWNNCKCSQEQHTHKFEVLEQQQMPTGTKHTNLKCVYVLELCCSYHHTYQE